MYVHQCWFLCLLSTLSHVMNNFVLTFCYMPYVEVVFRFWHVQFHPLSVLDMTIRYKFFDGDATLMQKMHAPDKPLMLHVVAGLDFVALEVHGQYIEINNKPWAALQKPITSGENYCLGGGGENPTPPPTMAIFRYI